MLFSNVFIAMCAVIQGLVTYRLLHLEPEKHVLGILFCATLALYNFSILLAKPRKPEDSSCKRVKWIFSHHRFMITLTLVAILSLVALFFFLSLSAAALLVSLALISVAYNVPMVYFQNKWLRLRQIPGAKLFLIALVWSLSCVLLPILELNTRADISWFNTGVLVAMEFFFIAAITIPFDIRDFFQDKRDALHTLPTMLGAHKSKQIAYIFLGLYLLLLVLLGADAYAREIFIALVLSTVLAAWLIKRANAQKSEYFYFLLLDGTMLVGVMVL